MDDPPVSRTRQYVEQRSQQRMNETRLAGLEAQLEDEERRNLRLSNQLLDEVALRARAERSLNDVREELETATLKLSEMEKTKRPRKSKDATPEETPPPVEKKPPPKQSSRTRGNVK